MWLYLAVFLVPFVYFFLKGEDGTNNNGLLALFFVFLGLFVGLGDMLGGYDRYIYGELFDALADNLRDGVPLSQSVLYNGYHDEMGYVVFNWLLAHVTANRYVFILLLTLCMYAMIWWNMKKYASNYSLALVLFMGLTFFFTFTYLRQMMGCAIACFSIQYIIKRDLWRYLLVMLVAISFHKSAIIFLPIYFLPVRKYSVDGILTVMLICLLLGLSGVTSMLFDAYADIKNEEAESYYGVKTSSRLAYIVEAVFFLYLLLRVHRHLPEDGQSIVLYNIGLAFCAVLLFFVRSENGGRLSWYFMYGLIFTVVNFANSRTGRQMNMHLLVLVVCFFLFMRVNYSWAFNMCPYKTFLTPGHTAAEWIYERYEYDLVYDVDKFYR